MLVSELIEKLKKMPQEHNVIVNRYCLKYRVNRIELISQYNQVIIKDASYED